MTSRRGAAMVASVAAVAITGVAALTVNLGLVGQSGRPQRAVLSSQVVPPSTTVVYRDVYDLPPTTAVPPTTKAAPAGGRAPTPTTTRP